MCVCVRVRVYCCVFARPARTIVAEGDGVDGRGVGFRSLASAFLQAEPVKNLQEFVVVVFPLLFFSPPLANIIDRTRKKLGAIEPTSTRTGKENTRKRTLPVCRDQRTIVP